MNDLVNYLFYRSYQRCIMFCALVASFWGCAFSQITGIITASDTKLPIPYANIWVDNLNIGTTSDLKGAFSFQENLIGKTLLISAIGYYSDSCTIESGHSTILLKPREYLIPEVAVQTYKGQNKRIIESFKKSKIDNFYCPGSPNIFARHIILSDSQQLAHFVESIKIITISKIKSKINLRIFSVTETGEPGEDLLEQNLIITVKEGLRIITEIPLSSYEKIIIPSEGIFIAFEFLILPENVYIPKYLNREPDNKKIRNYPGNDTSKAEIRTYMPMLGAIESEESENAWTFHSGKWHQDFSVGVDLTFTSKHRTIAMEVIVSN